jgi:hypothetical protein|tara:strand:- start:1463 stop:2353 length:891 start_codon:yes stop_codon:yes gene_type:complete
MIKFKQFIQLNEGGNAVEGVVGINQENSIATVKSAFKDYLKPLGLSEKDTALLGSTGKKAPKAVSGDIDIALSSREILKHKNVSTFGDMIDLIISITKKKGYKFKDLRSIGIVSVGYPITNADGKQEGKTVQLDFMLVDSVKLASWTYYSPSYLESSLKGLYRNELLYGVAKFAGLKVKEMSNDNQPITWDRFWFSLSGGLQKGTQSLKSLKTGKITKTAKKVSSETLSDDPDTIIKYLFGSSYKAKDVLTFEQALKAVQSSSFPHKKHRKDIYKMAKEGLLKKKYPVPEALDKLI